MDRDLIDGLLTKLETMAARIADLERQPTRTKHNYAGAAAPTADDDISAGYSIGSEWADLSASPPDIYKCQDNADGAAVWGQITPV